MTQDQFCYWLQGFFEMTKEEKLSKAQIKMIKEHLALVFEKKTSNLGDFLKPDPYKGPFTAPSDPICKAVWDTSILPTTYCGTGKVTMPNTTTTSTGAIC